MSKKLLVAPAALLFALIFIRPASAKHHWNVVVGGYPGYYGCPVDPYSYPGPLPADCYDYYGYPYTRVYPYFGWGGGFGGLQGGHEFHGGGFHGGGFQGGGFHGGGFHGGGGGFHGGGGHGGGHR